MMNRRKNFSRHESGKTDNLIVLKLDPFTMRTRQASHDRVIHRLIEDTENLCFFSPKDIRQAG